MSPTAAGAISDSVAGPSKGEQAPVEPPAVDESAAGHSTEGKAGGCTGDGSKRIRK
jgi:hypothetical protein